MGHRMVLGYGAGLTIFLKDHVQRQQAKSLLHDAVATNFQFVEHPSVIPRAAQIQRGPASPPIDHGSFGALRAMPPRGVPRASRIVPGRTIRRRGYYPQPGVGAPRLPRMGDPQS